MSRPLNIYPAGIAFEEGPAAGAWPNGTRVEKTQSAPTDTHRDGAPGTVRGSIGAAEDDGWRFIGLTYVAAEEGSAILVIEAGPDCKAEQDEKTTMGEWSTVGSGGELRIRSTMEPVIVLELVCETGADEPSHHVRIEEGQRITADLIMRIEDLLIAVDEEHSERLEDERREALDEGEPQ